MPRIPTESQVLTEPPVPPTDIRGAQNERTGQWVLVEMSLSTDAWIEIDDQHVYPMEALE